MKRTFLLIYFLAMVIPLSAQNDKKELVNLWDDFTEMRWRVWSFSEGDSIVSFQLDGVRSRSQPSSVSVKGTLNTKQDEWLVSPLFDCGGSESVPLLTFYEAQDFWLQSEGIHQLLYAFGPNPSKGDFVVLYTWNRENHVITNFLASPSSFTLEPLAGKSEVTIAFRYANDSTVLGDNWYIDDVKITQNILYDGAAVYSSLNDGQKISAAAETNAVFYVQNRGTEPIKFPVKAVLENYLGVTIWSAEDSTGELESFGKDTVKFSLPAVDDSSSYALYFFTDAAFDQYRGNDTLKIFLQSFETSKNVLAESFLYSYNYYSEGTFLALDSALNNEGTAFLGIQHFFVPSDTLYREASGNLADDLLMKTPSMILIDRKERLYLPYTSEQDWTKGISKITAAVNKRNLLGSPFELSGSAIPSVVNGRFEVTVQVKQTADLAPGKYIAEIWLWEKERNFKWLRLSKIKKRAFDKIFSAEFNSAGRNDVVFNKTVTNYLPSSSGTDSLSSQQAEYLLVVTDPVNGEIVNSSYIRISSGIVTDIPEGSESGIPADFDIVRVWPNPFNPSVSVRFYLKKGGKVSADIFTVSGRKVYSFREYFPAGENIFRWNAAELSSGTYFLRLTNGHQERFTKLLLVK